MTNEADNTEENLETVTEFIKYVHGSYENKKIIVDAIKGKIFLT